MPSQNTVRFVAGALLALLMSAEIAMAAVSGDEEVVARINGINITKGEVRQRVEIYERAHPGLAPGEARLRRAGIAAQVLIYAVLAEQLARDLGVSVSDSEVEAYYAKTRGKQDEHTFVGFLRLQGNDPANLRRDLRRALLDEKIKAKLKDAMVVTERDIKARYEEEKVALYPEQVKARQIVVLTQDLATQLHHQLKEGADFAELARSTSTEKSSRENGGDLSWVLRGTGHYPPWDDLVFKMKPGELSEPFETVHGWHIVKVDGYRPVGWGRMEDKRDLLIRLIKETRASQEIQRRLDDLKKRADLWVLPRIEIDAPDAASTLSQK